MYTLNINQSNMLTKLKKHDFVKKMQKDILFNCPDIPTTLTVWDLWTDPVGVAALLDVWGEKLGGPRVGV